MLSVQLYYGIFSMFSSAEMVKVAVFLSFASHFNKITSVLVFRLFSGIVLLITKDTCMVPAGFTLAKHSCYRTVPWAVLCQLQHVFSYMPPAVHNLPPYITAQYSIA